MCHTQIQQQPAGTYTYQEHFNRTAAAMAVPAFAVLLHYVSVVALDLKQRRDLRKLQRLEEAKRAMLKELKARGADTAGKGAGAWGEEKGVVSQKQEGGREGRPGPVSSPEVPVAMLCTPTAAAMAHTYTAAALRPSLHTTSHHNHHHRTHPDVLLECSGHGAAVQTCMCVCVMLLCMYMCACVTSCCAQEMTRFDRIKTLIDRFDPDARPPPPAQPGEDRGEGE